MGPAGQLLVVVAELAVKAIGAEPIAVPVPYANRFCTPRRSSPSSSSPSGAVPDLGPVELSPLSV